MAIDDAVVDTIKARLLMMNKTIDSWYCNKKYFSFSYHYYFLKKNVDK